MAKKKNTTAQTVEQVVEQPVETVVQKKPVVKKETKPFWEIKDRVY